MSIIVLLSLIHFSHIFSFIELTFINLKRLYSQFDGRLVVLGVYRHFNSKGHTMAVSDAYVFPGFLTPVLTHFFLSKATDYFSHTPERYFALTEDRIHNHHVLSPARSPLSQPGGVSTDLHTQGFKLQR